MNPLLKRIKLIDNRSRDEDIRLDLYATLIPYILSVDIFKNNIDIKDFIESLSLQNELREYVYKSRTLIAARMSREIQKGDRNQLLHFVKALKNHASNQEDDNESNKKNIVEMLNKYSRNK